MFVPQIQDRRPVVAVLVALIALAWLALVLWGRSPYARLLSHEAIGSSQPESVFEYAGVAAAFVAGWTVMTVAMMLPTALPLLLLFRRFISSRANAPALLAWLMTGYLAIWMLFGVVAHLADFGIHRAVASSHRLEDNAWLLGVAPLILAGVYQFTPLKYLCLEKCRSPYSFIVEHWQGKNASMEALKLGLHHGLFCVGCCWSLMLLMFSVGMGNLAWMLALGVVMAIEKNMPWGRHLSTPLGVILLTAGMTLLALHGGDVACAHDGTSCSHGAP